MLFQIGLVINGNGKKVQILANRKSLKEWEDEKGVILRKRKRKINNITERQYKHFIRTEYIICKTEKGAEYLAEI